MAFCEQSACDAWATEEVWLAVAVENEAARALYDSLGYVRHGGVVKGDVLLMRRCGT